MTFDFLLSVFSFSSPSLSCTFVQPEMKSGHQFIPLWQTESLACENTKRKNISNLFYGKQFGFIQVRIMKIQLPQEKFESH